MLKKIILIGLFLIFNLFSFADNLSTKIIRPFFLRDLNLYNRNQIIRIDPREGMILEIHGNSYQRISLRFKKSTTENGIQVRKLLFENNRDTIILNEDGIGKFYIGAEIKTNKSIKLGHSIINIEAKLIYED